jgi:hypothetical protein
MNRIDLQFLLLAALSLVVGIGLGIFMGITHDFSYVPVHAHVNLVGWASLGLFGLAYRAYPELASRKLAKVHVALAAPSAILLPLGIYFSMTADSPLLAIGSSLIWFAGCLVFLYQVASLMFGRRPVEIEPAAVPAE